MNVPVMFSKLGAAARSAMGTGKFLLKKRAPELMLAGGIVSFVASIVETVNATNKTNEILEEKEDRIHQINEEKRINENYTPLMMDADIRNVNRNTKWALVKIWTPVGTTVLLAISLTLGAYGKIYGRYVAVGSAYKGLEEFTNRYRRNVIDEFGKDVDWRMANNIKAEELAAARKEQEENREIALNNKQKKICKQKPKTAYADITSVIFDQYSERWRRSWNAQQVWNYLVDVENEMTDKLRLNKSLFLNEVYDRLGLPRTKEGVVTGWLWTKDKENDPNFRVSFGLDDMPEDARRDFLQETWNDNIWIRLHFNTDGLIYNLIDKDTFVRRCR